KPLGAHRPGLFPRRETLAASPASRLQPRSPRSPVSALRALVSRVTRSPSRPCVTPKQAGGTGLPAPPVAAVLPTSRSLQSVDLDPVDPGCDKGQAVVAEGSRVGRRRSPERRQRRVALARGLGEQLERVAVQFDA